MTGLRLMRNLNTTSTSCSWSVRDTRRIWSTRAGSLSLYWCTLMDWVCESNSANMGEFFLSSEPMGGVPEGCREGGMSSLMALYWEGFRRLNNLYLGFLVSYWELVLPANEYRHVL